MKEAARYIVAFLGMGLVGLLLAAIVQRFIIVFVASILNIVVYVAVLNPVFGDSLWVLAAVLATSIVIFFGAVLANSLVERRKS